MREGYELSLDLFCHIEIIIFNFEAHSVITIRGHNIMTQYMESTHN